GAAPGDRRGCSRAGRRHGRRDPGHHGLRGMAGVAGDGRAAAGQAGRAQPGAAQQDRLTAGGHRTRPAGHGHPAGPAARGGPDGGAGAQRGRQRDRGRGRPQRRHRLRRQPQPPARPARPVRRASPVLYGVTWDAAVTNNSGTGVGPMMPTVKHDRQVAAWATYSAGVPLRAGRTEVEAIVLEMPGAASFVPAPVTGRLPKSDGEIALGTRTLRNLHAQAGATIRVSIPLLHAPPRPLTVVGTTVFPTLSDTLGLGTGAALTPAGLRYLVPATAPMSPPAAVFVRFRPGVEPPAGRADLAARLAKVGSVTVDGPATPTRPLNFGPVRDLR